MCWTDPGAGWPTSKKPPVPGVDASTKVSGETHSALPAVSMSWVSVTCLGPQLLRVHLDLELPVPLAVDGYVRDAGHAHQAAA